MKLALFDVLSRVGGAEWSLAAAGTGRLTLEASGNENVRATLALEALLGEVAYVDVARAFVRVRFPWFRATIGKAGLSWGEGFYLNAGDVIFGPVGSTADLTADELRDDAAWQTAVYVPLGPFSFLEAVGIIPELDILEALEDPGSAEAPSAAESAAGARVLARLGGTQVQGGSLFRAPTESHHPYLAAQGNLYLDWYLSTTTTVPQWSPEAWDLWRELIAGAGLFHLARLPGRSDLALRLEALARPSAWDEENAALSHGLLLYPEAVWNAGPSVSVVLRGFLSPLDRSGLCSVMVGWDVYQGLEVIALAAAQFGDADDLYGWDRPGGVALTTGVQFIY